MEKLPFNANTIDALINALGAVVFATVRQLPPAQQEAFANDLARLAANAERQGKTTDETILIDLQNAARAAV